MATRLNLKGLASFPHLVTPHRAGRPGYQQGEPKYSVNIILADDTDWAALQGALNQAVAETFPNGWPNGGRWPLKQYSEQDPPPKPELLGKYYISAKSTDKVPVVDAAVVPLDPGEIYPGAVIEAAVACDGYNNAGQGVAFYLNAVRKIGDGPRLDNRPSVDQLFQPIAPQNAPGYDPAAFPQGTAQRAAEGGAPTAFGQPGQDPNAYQQQQPAPPQGQPAYTPPAQPGNGAAHPQGQPGMAPQGQPAGAAPGAPLAPGQMPWPQGGGQS
jgi:hypothetical protein